MGLTKEAPMLNFLRKLLSVDSQFYCLKERQMYELHHEIQKEKNIKNFTMF